MKYALCSLGVLLFSLPGMVWAQQPGGSRKPQTQQIDLSSLDTEEIVVFLQPGTDPKAFAAAHGLALHLKLLDDPNNGYVFGAGSIAAARTAQTAVATDNQVVAVYPNQISLNERMAFVPNDPYFHRDTPSSGFNGQWHLINEYVSGRDARVQGAWNRDITGSGVIVGICDDSTQPTHPDLSPNYDAADSWDFGQNDSDPSPVYSNDQHGISTSGVSAARGGNSIGVTGAAPLATFAGLRLDFTSGTTTMFYNATIYHSSGANTNIKIKNHSYGITAPYITSTLEKGGLATSAAAGTIHCFAAGNDRGTTGEDSNKKDLQSSPDVIAVAAFGSNGTYSSYSCYGANVFVCSPSNSYTAGAFAGITTTDRMGESAGYNGGGDTLPDGDYTSQFGGTSSATPLVVGVLALVKQVQPALNLRFAKHLLVRTCDVVDAGDSTATSDGGWKTNAAGYKFNQNYGFGLVNADQLTLKAVQYTGVTAMTTATSGTVTVSTAIPDNNPTGVTRTFSISGGQPVEDVTVKLVITHPYRGDLEAYLTSPSGTTSRLMKSAGDSSANINWTFLTNAFWGESPSGTWSLKVADLFSSDVGTWTNYTATVRMGTLIPAATVPTITSITSTTANGAYAVGSNVNVTVNFSAPVTLAGGTLNVTLETGATDRVVSISAFGPASSASGTYTVQAGDTSPDLNVNTLALTGGATLRDAALNNADLSLPSGNNLANNKAIVIDTTAPTITFITSTTLNGSYAVGANVNVTVNFSELVTLSGGTLQVTLETGATDRVVTISAFGPASSAGGTYTVQAGDTSLDLNANTVALSAGTLRDAAGNNTSLSLPGGSNLADNKAIVIDTTAPAVTSITSTTVDGAYTVGTNVNVTVNFSELVTLSGGTLQVTLETGAIDRVATISAFGPATSASGTYTVQAGDTSPDLNVNTLALSAGTLRDAAGNDTSLLLPIASNLADNKAIVIDTAAPTVTSITSTTPNGGYAVGVNVNVTVNFSEPVTLVAGTLQVTLETGTVDRIVSISPFGPASSATGIYVVQAGDASLDLNANDLSLSAGTLRDAAGNNASLSLPIGNNLADNKAIVIDTIAPTIVSITSTTANGAYSTGAVVDVTVNFSEPVTLVGGTLQVTLETGAIDRVVAIPAFGPATSASGSYTVQAGDASLDLDANSVSLNTGTLRDVATNNTDLSLPIGGNLADNKGIVIDTGSPTITSITSTTSDGSYSAGAVINVIVNFSEPVTLAGGSLDVTLETGTVDQVVSVSAFGPAASASGTFTVQLGDNSPDLDVNSLALSSGTMRDGAGNDANLSLPGGNNLADNKAIILDTSPPTITSITSTTSDGSYSAGAVVGITVNFSEPVVLAGGTLDITLETGAVDAVVSISTFGPAASASGTYTVQLGDNSPDLDVNGLALITGTLRDAASNDANLSLPGGNSLADNKAIVVDTIAPVITSITSATSDGSYSAGAIVDVTASFSEPVTLAGGTLDITLETGAVDAVVSITAFGPTASASGAFAVQLGDDSPDLDVNGLALSTGTLRDAAGNDANLSLPGGSNLADNKAIIIDTSPPTITSITSTTSDGSYSAGAVVDITVNFSEPVVLAGGTLDITLETGAVDAVVSIAAFGPMVSASGTYTVQLGDNSPDLDANGLVLSTGTLRDAAGNDANLALPGANSLADNKELVIDTSGTPPSITAAVSRYTHAAAGTFDMNVQLSGAIECRLGAPSQLVVTFDQPVDRVNGSLADVTVTIGSVTGISAVGNEVTVDLAGVGSGQMLTVAFPGIAASGNLSLISSETFCFGILTCDVNADGLANILDLVEVRNHLNLAAQAGNFRNDVSGDGNVDILDLVVIRNHLNTALSGTCPP